jgi:choline kinase
VTAAIVLAAGVGSRLTANAGRPKWLVPVGGGCPAAAHLAAFVASGVARLFVVVGDVRSAEMVDAYVEPWRADLPIDLVPNESYATRNNWFSLLRGLDAWLGAPGDEVVVVNSDLYADAAWFVELLQRASAAPAAAVLAVDPARGRNAEAMKVAVSPRGDRIVAIGKVGIPDPAGESVGLGRWTRPAAEELRSILQRFATDPARADCWYEHAIDAQLAEGGRYGLVPVPDGAWVEIDDDDDLRWAADLAGARGRA